MRWRPDMNQTEMCPKTSERCMTEWAESVQVASSVQFISMVLDTKVPMKKDHSQMQ
jgi:hypothetical protein